MTWGELEIKVHFLRIPKAKIGQELEEAEETVKYCEKRLLQLATATPRDFGDVHWEDYVSLEVDRLVTDLVEAAGKIRALAQAVDEPGRILESE